MITKHIRVRAKRCSTKWIWIKSTILMIIGLIMEHRMKRKAILTWIPNHLFLKIIKEEEDHPRACHNNGMHIHKYHNQRQICPLKIRLWIRDNHNLNKGTLTAKLTIKKGRNRRISKGIMEVINNSTESLVNSVEVKREIIKVRKRLFLRMAR